MFEEEEEDLGENEFVFEKEGNGRYFEGTETKRAAYPPSNSICFSLFYTFLVRLLIS